MSTSNKDKITEKFNILVDEKMTRGEKISVTKYKISKLTLNEAVQEISKILRDFQDLGHDVHLSVFDHQSEWKNDVYSHVTTSYLNGVLKIGAGQYFFNLSAHDKNNIIVLLSKSDMNHIGNHAYKYSSSSKIVNDFDKQEFKLETFDGFTKFQDYIIEKLAHQKWIANNDIANSLNNNKNMNKPNYTLHKKSGLGS